MKPKQVEIIKIEKAIRVLKGDHIHMVDDFKAVALPRGFPDYPELKPEIERLPIRIFTKHEKKIPPNLPRAIFENIKTWYIAVSEKETIGPIRMIDLIDRFGADMIELLIDLNDQRHAIRLLREERRTDKETIDNLTVGLDEYKSLYAALRDTFHYLRDLSPWRFFVLWLKRKFGRKENEKKLL
jgi:hypothetical protein